MGKKSILKWVILSFLAVGSIGSYLIYDHNKNELLPAAKKHLGALAKAKTDQILAHFHEQEKAFFSSTSTNQFIFTASDASASGLTTSLGNSVSRVRMTLATDISTFSLNPTTNLPEIFISFPLFKDKIFQGVLSAKVDTDSVYDLVKDPAGLGRTGMTVLVRETPTKNVILIAPLRNDPTAAFKKEAPLKETPTFIQSVLTGVTGSGKGVDGYGVDCVASWNYIPEVNWGIIIKMDLAEVLQPIRKYELIFYALLAITLGFFIYCAGTSLKFLRSISHERKQVLKTRIGLTVISAISALGLLLLILSIVDYTRGTGRAFQQMETNAQIQAEKVSQSLNYDLYRVQSVGQSIADDLSHGKLAESSLSQRMDILLKENYQIFGILVAYASTEYNPDERPFAAESVRNGGQIEYKQLNTAPVNPEADWYLHPPSEGGAWLNPQIDPVRNTLVAVYAAPFYKEGNKRPIGTVFSFYNVEQLKGLASSFQISDTSYGFIISQNGVFIYYPTESYVFDGKKLFDVATQMGSQSLMQMAQKATHGQKGFESFEDNQTGQTFWVYYLPIPTANWSLGVVVNQTEIIPPIAQLQRYYLNIILAATLALISISGLLFQVHKGQHHHLVKWSPLTCVIFATAIICFWVVVQKTSSSATGGNVIIDQLQLNRILSEVQERFSQRGEPPPIVIPTGIYIYNLEFPDSDHVLFSGYVWQKYPENTPETIERDIAFPEALSVDKVEAYRETKNGIETIGWRIIVKAPLVVDYGRYPVDVIRTHTLMQQKNVGKKIILVPDLDGYSNIRPNAKPGLSSLFSMPGYKIANSLFSIQSQASNTNFGVETQRKSEDLTNLIYSIRIERSILETLIVYLLPLFAGLVAMFVTFWIVNRASGETEILTNDILGAITIYTALIFALILLHTALRSRFISGSILYVEYFFFTTYLTIFLLICHSLIMYARLKFHKTLIKLNPYFHIHFWQIQFAVWFLITVAIFY